jgi:hypothetical protein
MINVGAMKRATFMISGLHGPRDALRLERYLASHQGIRRAVVRWDFREAKTEFDEHIVSAQAVTRLIAKSNAGRHAEELVARLLLKVPSVRIEEKARLPAYVLSKLPGVESVTPQMAFQAVEVVTSSAFITRR